VRGAEGPPDGAEGPIRLLFPLRPLATGPRPAAPVGPHSLSTDA
jgi:hypothetical protein